MAEPVDRPAGRDTLGIRQSTIVNSLGTYQRHGDGYQTAPRSSGAFVASEAGFAWLDQAQ